MNILYIAYSCLPCKGSEEKIGWNIPVESAKTNQVFVITKEEHREGIEAYLNAHKVDNIRFYYVDIPHIYKKLLKGVAYSVRLNIWHKRAYPTAKEICVKEHIDVVHQITPIEFRSIGNYGKIPNIKFVCGPLGGGEFLPDGLKVYAKRNRFVEHSRAMLNRWFRLKHKLSNKLQKCAYVLFANKETGEYLSELVQNVPHRLCFDNGISESDITPTVRENKEKRKFVMIVAGRLAYRKGHSFLLDALKDLPEDIDYQCRILGEGPEALRLKAKCELYGLQDKVVFTGRIPFAEMAKEYENADVFIMPSIRETTGAVLLEAMSKGLPVITINKFGGPVLLDDDSGWLYSGNSREDYIKGLSQAIIECVSNPDEMRRRGQNARKAAEQNVWSKKVKYYNSIYEGCCEEMRLPS